MNQILFTKYFHLDKTIVTQDKLNIAIEEQLENFRGGINKLSPSEYNHPVFGITYLYEVIETDTGYKVIGRSKFSTLFWVWLILGLFASFVGAIGVVIIFLFFKHKFEGSISNAENTFLKPSLIPSTDLNNKYDQIEKLQSLKVRGILTEEEFEEQKKKILNS